MKIRNTQLIHSTLFFLILCFVFLASCSKDLDGVNSKPGISTLQVSASIGDFSEESIGVKKASSNVSPLMDETIVHTTKVSEDLTIVATLAPDQGQLDLPGSSKFTKKASTTVLGANFWYKLLVFKKSTGDFLFEKNYQRGHESTDTSPLKLDGGVEYTFVAYSVGTTNLADLPTYASNPLLNSGITVDANTDLLYFKKDLVISGEANDYLEIVFKRQNSQVTTVIRANSAPAGNNIEEVLASFEIPRNMAVFNLSTAVADWSVGTPSTKDANTFSIINNAPTERSATSVTKLFAETGTVEFLLRKLKVGSALFDASVSGQPAKPFANKLVLNPGKKYVLTLDVNPTIASVATLDCSNAILEASGVSSAIRQGVPFTGILKIAYTGGNGLAYPAFVETVNGITVALRAGVASSSGGYLVYDVTGTATSSSIRSVPVRVGTVTCTAYLPVVSSSVNTLLIPYIPTGNFDLVGVSGMDPITVTANYDAITKKGGTTPNIVCGMQHSGNYLLMQGYEPLSTRLSFKFSRPISNLTVKQMGTNIGETYTFTLKRNGVVVGTNISFNSMGTCDNIFTVIGGNTVALAQTEPHPIGATVSYYVFSIGLFDEVQIDGFQPDNQNGSLFDFIVGPALP